MIPHGMAARLDEILQQRAVAAAPPAARPLGDVLARVAPWRPCPFARCEDMAEVDYIVPVGTPDAEECVQVCARHGRLLQAATTAARQARGVYLDGTSGVHLAE